MPRPVAHALVKFNLSHTMYKVKGADQKEYGPITIEGVRQWIAENRLNRFSLCQKEDSPGWRALGQFPEFEEALRLQPPQQAPPMGESAPLAPSPTVAPLSKPIPGPGFGTPLPGGPSSHSPEFSGSFAQTSSREDALRRVNAPAISLMVFAAITMLFGLSGVFMKGAWMDFATQTIEQMNIPIDPNTRAMLDAQGQGLHPLDFVQLVFAAAINALIFFGALQMQRLQHWGLGLTAAILAMVPCCTSCCCIVGLPLGIWSIVVLNQPEVRGHFR